MLASSLEIGFFDFTWAQTGHPNLVSGPGAISVYDLEGLPTS